MLLTIETCTTALRAALQNRRTAVQVEMSVGLAVFHSHGGATKDARKMVVHAFCAAGYECDSIGGRDYKTVNRRINATVSLYEKMPVAKWIGKLEGIDAIHAVFDGIAPYELHSIQDVLRYAAPHKVAAAKVAVVPNTDILAGPPTGHEKVLQQFRRASDRTDARLVSTEHIHLAVPKDADVDEVMDIISQLMLLVRESKKELLTA